MQNENNMNADLITFGVAVHGDTDSGWKVTGFTSGLDPEKSLKLATFTSVGEISETWARVFEHGFGYFGRQPEEDRAVFALFYRSQAKSARGRHFVPRIVLSIPYSDYVDKLHSDPEILFQCLVKYKNEKAPVQCDKEPLELEPFYHIPPSSRTLEEQLLPLNKAIESGIVTPEFLIDFLTAVLRPEPHFTLVWGGENPDAQLVLSMIFLLPPTLRQFITFCTSVENPRVGNFRIKIIKEPVSPGNNTFAVMKDKSFTIRKSPLPFDTPIPKTLVEELISPGKTGTDVSALAEIHRFFEAALAAEPGTIVNFKHSLTNTGILAELYLLKKQVKTSTQPDIILTQLQQYCIKLQTLQEEQVLENQQALEAERQFLVNQFARVVREIKSEAQIEAVKDELQKLAKKLPALKEKEPGKLSQTLFKKGEELPLKAFLPILKAFYSIPALKEAIDLELFKQLKLEHDPGWEEAFELVTMIRNAAQCNDLKTVNKKLYQQLKQQPGIDYFIDLLLLSFPSQKLDSHLFKGVCKKVEQIGMEHKGNIFIILLFVFKRLEQFEPGLHHLYFLLAAAHSYKFINKIPIFAKREQEFQEQFKQRLYQVCNLELDQEGEEQLKEIYDTISEFDPPFAKQLMVIGKQAIFSRRLEECNHLLKGEDRPLFKEEGDLYRFLQQLDKNKVSRYHRYLSTAGLHLIIGNNRPPGPILYADYLDYIKQKEELDDIDIQNIIGILFNNDSPIDYTHLLETLTLAFSRRPEYSPARFVSFLLNLAKNYERGEGQDIIKIENTFIRTVKDNWKPNTCDEVRETYQAVNRGLGKSLGDRILRIGFSRLSRNERIKYFTRILIEFFNEISRISLDDWASLRELLEWIDTDDSWKLMYVNDELIKIKEEKDTIENSMEQIKALLKKLKKIKLYHHEKNE